MERASLVRLAVGLALVLSVALSLALLPVKDYALGFLQWVEDLGPWGPVVVAAVYVPACLLFVPGSLITLGTGAIFGVPVGTVTISIGSTLGATAAFLVGRTLARGFIEERLARHPKFAAIDRAVAEQGFKIVLLTRLSPAIPFNLLNYAFGLTRVRLRDYVLASWIGMLPGTVMYVYLGSAVKDLAALAAGNYDGGPAQKALFFGGLAATVLVTVLITRIARRALDQAIAEQDAGRTDCQSVRPDTDRATEEVTHG
jgi:uncharacterized membrane protein YdjX (TVP38/TMEM64 family)